MISIDRVYKTLNTLANTDMRGNAKPDEIRLLINQSVNEIVDSYFTELNRAVSRENIGRINNNLENIPDRIREKILHFEKRESVAKNLDGTFPIPNDLLFIDTVEVGYAGKGTGKTNYYLAEETKHRSEYITIKRVNASKQYPVYFKLGNVLEIAPDGDYSVRIHYLRKHKIAKWSFVVVNGQELVNPGASDFQDIDLHPSEEMNVIIKTAEKLGINLKEQDLVQIAMQKEQQGFANQNS